MLAAVAAVSVISFPGRLPAEITVGGDVSPAYDATDPWLVGQELIVGYAGEGDLDILNGSHVEADMVLVALLFGSSGSVTVDGVSSTLSLLGGGGGWPGAFAYGQGNMTVSNGGSVEVDGTDALLNVARTITVGSQGEGDMTISHGGTVISERGVIGGYDPRYGHLADYFDPGTDEGSVWSVPSLLTVGLSGAGTLGIAEGSWVDGVATWIGMMPDARGTVNVTGQNSGLRGGTVFGVGLWGQGRLVISQGAHVIADDFAIGGISLAALNEAFDPDLIPDGAGAVVVTGAGSQLDARGIDGLFDDTLYVGYSGQGALDVNDGGTVFARYAIVGAAPEAVGTVTVQDPDSHLSVSSRMAVGAWGTGSLTITNGGLVETDTLEVGGWSTR
jgi:T5SS/PEP-CTERM-associated repeat protein